MDTCGHLWLELTSLRAQQARPQAPGPRPSESGAAPTKDDAACTLARVQQSRARLLPFLRASAQGPCRWPHPCWAAVWPSLTGGLVSVPPSGRARTEAVLPPLLCVSECPGPRLPSVLAGAKPLTPAFT